MTFLESLLRAFVVRFLASPVMQPRLPQRPERRRIYSRQPTGWGLDGAPDRRLPGTVSFLTDDGRPAEICQAERLAVPLLRARRARRAERCLPEVAPLPAPRGLLACSATPVPRGRRHGRRTGR